MPGSFIRNDLAALFNPNDFGVEQGSAVYGGNPVMGIFDNGHVEVQAGEGAVAIVRECAFTGRSVDFPNIAEGDFLMIDSAVYIIQEWMDDGEGEIQIRLEPSA
jgi:hypothetical protein